MVSLFSAAHSQIGTRRAETLRHVHVPRVEGQIYMYEVHFVFGKILSG